MNSISLLIVNKDYEKVKEGKQMLTPYAAHTRVNNALKENGIDSRIPPQMMYNYTSGKVKAGKKPLIKYNEKDGVDEKDFERWLSQYIEKKKAVLENAKKEVEELASES